MAIGAVRQSGAADRALSASYRRFTADAPRDERANLKSNFYVKPVDEAARQRGNTGNSPAALLGALIERMGGAVDSRAKGAYVNLRV
ncbi:MAG: hypothetical protein IT492_19455 [Gammaproteobacteria bacterium]|nr:hypothetical protein [Gammaproteobacteria bacterium]